MKKEVVNMKKQFETTMKEKIKFDHKNNEETKMQEEVDKQETKV